MDKGLSSTIMAKLEFDNLTTLMIQYNLIIMFPKYFKDSSLYFRPMKPRLTRLHG